MSNEALSAERLSEIRDEFTALSSDLNGSGAPPDGPGAVSAFYTSLSFADVLGAVSELISAREAVDRLTRELAVSEEAKNGYCKQWTAAVDARNATGARLAKMREALEHVATFKGQTLISMEHGQPYSNGANAAFEQAADIARTALGADHAPD